MSSGTRLDPVPLDDYDLREPLGSGAMARVFEAVHRKTGRAVAIKLLDGASRGSRELRERMAREAVVLASVTSPNVSRLLGYGWESDQPFLVLERLEGETLADVLRREGRLGAARLVDWVEQLLIGARDCHRANVIHRDIKPANIFLVRPPQGGEPTVKLIDFGVARLNEIASAGTSLTSTHHLIGSMGYMAPEQLEYAKGVAPTADLYAIGVVLFRCVSGRLPFVGRSFEALTKLKCEATAPVLSTMPGVVPNELLDAFVARALSRDPEARFGSATEMLEEWWRVAAALDRAAPMPEVDVVFDEDEWVSTIVESLSRSASNAIASSNGTTGANPVVRTMDDPEAATDPELQRPTENTLRAAREVDPPAD
ncbi:MAG TPA: serine/threonine-protein kinase [Polyangiaceae bacterium]|nr:serine/threonine-protein kinase [Polyangiaceae bacterium]